jgi:hypothetical protein
MNIVPTKGSSSTTDPRGVDRTGEDTLRLIAGLPAPAGLEDRVKAGLRSSPETGRILSWRGPLRPPSGWMYSGLVRGAAAAAIVGVVAGGGWRIYSHVQPPPAAKVIVMPSTGNGFSNANAVRVPQTLDRPVLKHLVKPAPEKNVIEKVPAQPKAVPSAKKKPVPLSAPMR